MSHLNGEPDALARVQRASAHYSQRPGSRLRGLRPDAHDAVGVQGSAAACSGRAAVTGSGRIQHDNESPNLELNDLGRLGTGDGLQFIGDFAIARRGPGAIFRSYWIGTRQTNEWNYGGDHVSQDRAALCEPGLAELLDHAGHATRRTAAALDSRLTRGGPLMEVPHGWSTNLQVRNRASSQTSWNAQVTVSGDEDGGFTRQLDTTIALRPGPQWQLSVAPSFLREVETQQYITARWRVAARTTYGRRYVFGAIDRSTYSTQFRLTYTFRPDVNLDVYAEPFAASGSYSNIGELAGGSTRDAAHLRERRNDRDATGRTAASSSLTARSTFTVANNDFNVRSFRSNVVLRWEYRPGSTLYLVWQQDRRVSEADRHRDQRRRSVPRAGRTGQQLLRHQDVVLVARPLTPSNGVDPGFSDVK